MNLTEAASVVLARGPGSPDLFIVRRADDLRFFPGYLVFPGGKIDAADAEVSIQTATGWQPDIRRVAAVRELFEETGVLLARRADGTFPIPTPDWAEPRQQLDAGQLTFGPFLASLGLTIHASDLAQVGRLVTPPFSALRFDTMFFQVNLPPGQEPVVCKGELVEGMWATPDELLGRWDAGEFPIAPPVLSMLDVLRGRSVAELPEQYAPTLAALERGELPTILFAPGVRMLPLHTVGLPPAVYTNAYLVGTGPSYLIDPGPHDPAEQGKMFHVLDARRAAGQPLKAIILTHQHPDHIGGAMACARRYNVPILAHRITAELLQGKVEVNGFLDEGDRIELGTAPDGSGPWHLGTLHTPGHAAGHLAFYEPHYQLLFAGDMVSMLSSVVIAPPDGDLAVYLASLRRLQTLACRLLLPAHGSATVRVAHTLQETLAHRRRREEQLLEALSPDEERTVAALTKAMYRGLAENLQRLAQLQVEAGLTKLEREGRVRQQMNDNEATWRLIS